MSSTTADSPMTTSLSYALIPTATAMAMATTSSAQPQPQPQPQHSSPSHLPSPKYNNAENPNVMYSDDPKSVYLPKIQLRSKAAERSMVERLCGYVPMAQQGTVVMPPIIASASASASASALTIVTTTVNNSPSTAGAGGAGAGASASAGGGLIVPSAVNKWLYVLERQRELRNASSAEAEASTENSGTDAMNTDTVGADHSHSPEHSQQPSKPTAPQPTNLTEETIAELKAAIEDYEKFIYPPYYDKILLKSTHTKEKEKEKEKEKLVVVEGSDAEADLARRRASQLSIAAALLDVQRRKVPALTQEAVEDLVSRLYTQDLSHRKQMLDKLRQQQAQGTGAGKGAKTASHSHDTSSPRNVTPDEVAEAVNRLASSDIEQRRENLQALVNKYYSAETTTTSLGPSQLEEFTQRIYYDYQAKVKQNQTELFQKYGFHRKRGKCAKLTLEQQQASATRLAVRPKRGES